MKTQNIRELSKKEKIKGLTRTAWIISIVTSIAFFPHILFFAFLITLLLLGFFYVLEFFDDDILDVIVAKMKQRSSNVFVA